MDLLSVKKIHTSSRTCLFPFLSPTVSTHTHTHFLPISSRKWSVFWAAFQVGRTLIHQTKTLCRFVSTATFSIKEGHWQSSVTKKFTVCVFVHIGSNSTKYVDTKFHTCICSHAPNNSCLNGWCFPDSSGYQTRSNHNKNIYACVYVCVRVCVHLSVAAILACLFDQPIKALRRGQIAWTNTQSLLQSLWISPSPSHTLTIMNTLRHTLPRV